LPNVIYFRGQLLAAFIIAQAMIEISFLPNNAVLTSLKMFLIANRFAHRRVALEREKRVQMIRYKEEESDMPALLSFVESSGI
jgi:hypothetical protein